MKTFILVGCLLVATSGLVGYHSATAEQQSRVQELEQENADLKEKLDNIQSLVSDAKSDLDAVESEAQRASLAKTQTPIQTRQMSKIS
jgi:Tfp pilus assembly protein PilN